jgi:hypothetical protein
MKLIPGLGSGISVLLFLDPCDSLVRTAEHAQLADHLARALVVEAFLWSRDVRDEISQIGEIVALRIAALGAYVDADVAPLAVIRIDLRFHLAFEPDTPYSYSIFRS